MAKKTYTIESTVETCRRVIYTTKVYKIRRVAIRYFLRAVALARTNKTEELRKVKLFVRNTEVGNFWQMPGVASAMKLPQNPAAWRMISEQET